MFKFLKNLFKKKEPSFPAAEIAFQSAEEIVELPAVTVAVVGAKKGVGIKMSDYPRDNYKAYWEVIRGNAGHKHSAVVRFYEYNGGKMVSESTLINSDKFNLKNNSTIIQ